MYRLRIVVSGVPDDVQAFQKRLEACFPDVDFSVAAARSMSIGSFGDIEMAWRHGTLEMSVSSRLVTRKAGRPRRR